MAVRDGIGYETRESPPPFGPTKISRVVMPSTTFLILSLFLCSTVWRWADSMLPLKSPVGSSSLIGVAIACSGNVLISLALTVQKLAHRRQHDELLSRSSSSTRVGNGDHGSPADEGPSASASASPSPSPSPKSRPAELTAVPVVMVPAEDGGPTSILQVDQPVRSNQAVDPRDSQRSSDARSSSPAPLKLPDQYRTKVHIRSPSPHDLNSPEADSGRGLGDGSSHEEDEVEEGMYLRSRLWWLGMVLITIGEGGNFLSYGFAPASVVAPLGTVALVANCIFAPLILKERFHLRELIGMGLAILGAVTVVWSSNSSNPRLDPAQLKAAIAQPAFIAYTVICAVFACVLIFLSRLPRFGGKYIGIDVGVCALFGGYTVLSTKALSSLLSIMFLSALRYPITWFLIAVLVSTSIMQIKYLNKALIRFESKQVIPAQFVFFSLAAIIGSAVLYQEFRGVAFSRFVNFAFGIGTTFLGVYLLTTFDGGSDEDATSNSRPGLHERATSSASLNLLLPTERTPLMIPSPEQMARTPSSTPFTAPPLGSLTGGSVRGRARVRLTSRASTKDFTTLGLNSQAGFLLLATTPPTAGMLMRRERSQSRGQRDLDEEGLVGEGRSRAGSLAFSPSGRQAG